jgi:hypothetical protein
MITSSCTYDLNKPSTCGQEQGGNLMGEKIRGREKSALSAPTELASKGQIERKCLEIPGAEQEK